MKPKPVVSIAYCLLVACGGGGSGDGSTGGSGDPGSGAASAPAPPVITYAGASGPADFNDGNAGVLADGMFATTFLALDIAQDIQGPPASAVGPFSYSAAGPQGGSATVNGLLNNDSTGWTQISFSDYQENGITYNGREVIAITQPLNGTNPEIGRISYYDLHAVGNNVNVDYVGTINRQIAGATNALWTVTGEVLIHDLLGSVEWYAQNIAITRQDITGGRELTVKSRVSESQFGYVDIATTNPWVFTTDATTPHHGGPLVGTGKDSRTLALSSLTPQLGAIEYMSVPEIKPDRSARITWVTPASQQTNSGTVRAAGAVTSAASSAPPVADAGAALTLVAGTKRTLDGRFSYRPAGGFLSFAWVLRSRPPGSAAALDDPNADQPAITFDLPGDYLIELTTSDGMLQTTDAISIPVRVDPTVAGFTPTPVQLAPDQKVAVGQTYTFTLQQPLSSFDPSPTFSIAGYAPDGELQNVPVNLDGTYHFTPTMSGVYRMVVTELDNGVQLDTQWLAADTDFHFLPAASIPRAFGDPEFAFVAHADLNGDGLADLVVSATDYNFTASLEIYHGNAAGGFDTATAINDGSGGPVVVGDFNGDGRMDIAVATTSGFYVLLQQADGSLGAPQSYSVGCYLPPNEAILAAGDFNGDGRTDIAVGGCHQILLFAQGADGLLHQSTVIATPAGPTGQSAVADLNGDGIPDLVVSLAGGSNNIMIIPGDHTAGFGTPYFIPEKWFAPAGAGLPAVATGDINGDGRADLLFSVDDNLGNRAIHVYLQQPDGTLKQGPLISTNGITTGIYIADVNGDGRADVVVASGDGPGVSIRYQNADGTLAAPLRDNRFNDGYVGSAQAITLMDVNRDGIPDVIAFDSDPDHQPSSKLVIGYGVAPGSENSQTQSQQALSADASSHHASSAHRGTRGSPTAESHKSP